MEEAQATLAGDVTGPKIIEAAPSPGSDPVTASQGESAPPSQSGTISDESAALAEPEAPKPPTRAELLEHARALSPEERAAFGKELRTIEEVNAEYQRDLAHHTATARAGIEKQVRDEALLRADIERDYAWFQSPEGQRGLLSGNPRIAARHAEVVGWLSNQTEAPIRERMQSEFESNSESRIKTSLATHPDLKLAADHWDDISKTVMAAGPDKVAELFVASLAVLAKSQYAQIERKYREGVKAQVNDGVAERVQGTDEPVMVGAGVAHNSSYKTLEEATLAHLRGDFDSDSDPRGNNQMRAYKRRFGA